MSGTIAIFFGIAMVAPFVIAPLVRFLSWPLRKASPVAGRLAADSARSDPGRTAATATGLMIGLALVVAVNSLGASFLDSIEEEFDRAFARDLSVRPAGFSPGEGPQQTIAKQVRERLAKLPETGVIARERILYSDEPAGAEGQDAARTASCSASSSPSTPSSTRPRSTAAAPRARRSSTRLAARRGDARRGPRRRDRARGRRPDRPRRALRDRADARRGDRRDGHLRRPDRRHVAGDDAEGLRRHRRLGAGAEGGIAGASAASSSAASSAILRRDYPNLVALSNEEVKAEVEAQVNEQFGIFYAIVGVAIFASMFGIVNTLSMSVLERTREIGVLRALGSTRWQVRRQVAAESVVIGLIGALLGIAVGAGLGCGAAARASPPASPASSTGRRSRRWPGSRWPASSSA